MRKLLLGLMLAFAVAAATPAQASITVCLSGCPEKVSAFGDLKLGEQPAPGQPGAISDQWWLGPEVGVEIYARDNATHVWEADFRPTFAYGLHWKPTWSPTPSFLALNVGLSASTAAVFGTGRTFDITIEPTLTIMDIVKVGYGPRWLLATDATTKDAVHGVFFFGLATSFDNPK